MGAREVATGSSHPDLGSHVHLDMDGGLATARLRGGHRLQQCDANGDWASLEAPWWTSMLKQWFQEAWIASGRYRKKIQRGLITIEGERKSKVEIDCLLGLRPMV